MYLLNIGDRAPDFRLLSGTGNFVSLSDFIGKKNLVLYFYPKDETPGCTKEACSFRDSYSAFKKFDAEVVGISSDGQSSHQEFARNENLPFPLLSDPGGLVRKAYGVKPSLGMIPGRTTFVIDKQGIIRHIYSSQIHAERHVGEALTALRTLTNQLSSQLASAIV
jgi:peroxiredoxin Q/BCP